MTGHRSALGGNAPAIIDDWVMSAIPSASGPMVSAYLPASATHKTVTCVMSLPRIRDRYHNLFEFTHRFLGWSTLLLLWGYAVLLVKWSSDGAEAGVGVL